MKLELARAMLYNADLLLLDEVIFHSTPIHFVADPSRWGYSAYQSCEDVTNA